MDETSYCGLVRPFIYWAGAAGVTGALNNYTQNRTGAARRPHDCPTVAVWSLYDFVIFLPPEKSHDARTIFAITVRAPHDVRTVASWSPCDTYNRAVVHEKFLTGAIQCLEICD